MAHAAKILEKRKKRTEGNESSAIKKAKGSDGTVIPHFKNKQRVLVLCTRGVTQRYRHLMSDMIKLLPHSKKEVKMQQKEQLFVINEIAEMKSCNNCLFFEVRKKQDLFLWFSKTPNGPSAKFHCHNVHTMKELRITGNCLKWSRPLVVFDPAFDSAPHLSLLKEMFTHVFSVPKDHPKSKPFIDHVISLSILDNRIWFRNYQIVDPPDKGEPGLVEIGPRFVLNLVKILAGSFTGATLYENPHYISPNKLRRMHKARKAGRYLARLQAKEAREEKKEKLVVEPNELDELFKK